MILSKSKMCKHWKTTKMYETDFNLTINDEKFFWTMSPTNWDLYKTQAAHLKPKSLLNNLRQRRTVCLHQGIRTNSMTWKEYAQKSALLSPMKRVRWCLTKHWRLPKVPSLQLIKMLTVRRKLKPHVLKNLPSGVAKTRESIMMMQHRWRMTSLMMH